MKKYIQMLVVFALVFTVVGLAKNNLVWADNTTEPIENSPSIALPEALQDPAKSNPAPPLITITETGVYNIEGICSLDIKYETDSGLSGEMDVDVPTDFSSNLPFGYVGDLYLPGCHIVHYQNDEMIKEINPNDGDAMICFAERPDVELTIYYYDEEPFTDNQIWIELETTHEDNFACASAIYTGEYAPGSKIEATPRFESKETTLYQPGYQQGSVVVPPSTVTFTSSGTYSIGGICTFRVLYHQPYQTNEIHVADALRHDSDPVDDYDYVDKPFDVFPEDEGLLNLPGCHVLHYNLDEITHWRKYVDQGDWEICFAAIPDKEMTIYYYLGDYDDQESSWIPLETTVENGEACAPAFFTGVYVPTSK